MKDEAKRLNISEDSSALSCSQNTKHEKPEEALYLRLNGMYSKIASVNDMILLQMAKDLSNKMSINDFAYSCGWSVRFKSCTSILQGEAASADITAVVRGKDELKSILLVSDYEIEHIFNIDETGLFFKLCPTHTLQSKTVADVK